MQQKVQQQRKPHRRPQGRSAVAILSVLISMAALFGFAALALDLALIAFKYQKLETCCESAALAGTAELSDRRLLCKNLQHLDLPIEIPRGTSVAAVQLAMADSQIQSYAAQNTGEGDSTKLDPKDPTSPQIETIVGWVENPTVIGSQMNPWKGRGPFNSLRIQASRTAQGGNPLTMTVGRMIGVPGADVVASARASYVQRIYGFRPTMQTSVPMLPLVVIPQAGPAGWLDQVCRATQRGNDRYQVNVISGDVRKGKDQVGEIELRFSLKEHEPKKLSLSKKEPIKKRRNVFVTSLTGETPSPRLIRQLTQWGYGPADLIPYGGVFALDAKRRQQVPVIAHPDASLLKALAQQFDLIRGARRIVPLGVLQPKSEKHPRCIVFDFAAVRVVDWRFEKENFTVIVQPCLLSTCTGLFRAGEPRNPWIGKLVLTQ